MPNCARTIGNTIGLNIGADSPVVPISNGSNVGGGPGLVFKQKNVTTMELRTFTGTGGISVTTVGDTVQISGSGGPGELSPIIIVETYIAGTNGGDFTSGVWFKRNLNSIVYNASGAASLASGQITLTAGTYILEGHAQANACGKHMIRFQNVTDNTNVAYGTSENCNTFDITTTSKVDAVFTIASSKTFELQHQCSISKTSVGLGSASGFAPETYTAVKLFKFV